MTKSNYSTVDSDCNPSRREKSVSGNKNNLGAFQVIENLGPIGPKNEKLTKETDEFVKKLEGRG